MLGMPACSASKNPKKRDATVNKKEMEKKNVGQIPELYKHVSD